jgi:cytochrome c551/c552
MKSLRFWYSLLWRIRLGLFLGLFVAILFWSGFEVSAIVTDLGMVNTLHKPQVEHVNQFDLQSEEAFEEAFELGDQLFATLFNAADGVGANVGQGQRFTRVPRADLNGPGEWANHFPLRVTGPNAQGCVSCHNQPFEDGAGSAAADINRDPLHTANLGSFIKRNTPHLFAIGAVQRLAEEITEELHSIRDRAQEEACQRGNSIQAPLSAKGIRFGTITVTPLEDEQREGDGDREPCRVNIDTSEVNGIDADLVVRPLQWKGNRAFVRHFNRDASHNELGMQPAEDVGDDLDGDFDGVVNEMSIGDQTVLAVYLAAQPRPTTRTELASLGLIDQLPAEEIQAIRRGDEVFQRIGCAVCHTPELKIDNPIFSEPSQNPHYRDDVFPGGQDPISQGVDPAHPIVFDLTRDQLDNQIKDSEGNIVFRLGSLERDRQGRAVVALFGDLKRHDMGPGLAEPIDEVGTGASVFLTENLWGVGSSAPYLHDGRATTLTEAILEHGGEAGSSRADFLALSSEAQQDLLAFLNNMVLFKIEEEEEE